MKTLCKLIILLGLSVYFVLAITLFNVPEKKYVCEGVDMIVVDSLQTGFISQNEIRAMLVKAELFPEGKDLREINLGEIENILSQSPYIESALCYKTVDNRIFIQVKPYIPMVHIMSDNGEDYYMDYFNRFIPSNEHYADLLIATGDISQTYARKKLAGLVRFIRNDNFWNQQVQQIHIQDNGEVEIVPRVGNHTILLGEASQYKSKLKRMQTFYTEGLNKVGWNKYSTISLKYDNQIVCTKAKQK